MELSASDPTSQQTEGAPPRHVAIIMDGNGRWANQRGMPRAEGHRQGVEALRRAVEAANELGIAHLSVFSFSTENWSRPPAEIDALFGLLRLYVFRDLKRLHKDGVRIRIFGSRDRLGDDILSLIDECEETTRNNTAFNLNIAFNYGSRAELANAAKVLAAKVAQGELDWHSIDEPALESAFWSQHLPDIDLMVRTSGERRLSNFMLWQAAYAELVFLDVLWPDFAKSDLEEALREFGLRERRYGGVVA